VAAAASEHQGILRNMIGCCVVNSMSAVPNIQRTELMIAIQHALRAMMRPAGEMS
jgi:hypothetical protein